MGVRVSQFGRFGLGVLVWAFWFGWFWSGQLCLGSLGLGGLVWAVQFGQFGLGSLVWV